MRFLKYMFFSLFLGFFSIQDSLIAQTVVEQARTDVAKLTSPEFRGRGYADNGHKLAAKYIQERFEAIGLKAAGKDKEYLQKFSLKANYFTETPMLMIEEKALRPGIDFLPYAQSGSGKGDAVVPVLRVGHGLYIHNMNLNDYANVSIDGAVLIIEDGAPENVTSNSAISKNLYSKNFKVETAMVGGAKAVIFLVDKLSAHSPNHGYSIPVFDVLQESFPANARTVSYAVKGRFKKVKTQNVYGLLPSKTDTKETILITAHYDHHGAMGEIYFPGANDNASGVAMLFSLAKYFTQNPIPYNLLFVAFSGEEAGLVGSTHFAKKPPIKLEEAAFLLNFDMVASGENGIMAVGGKDFPDHFATLQAVNDSLQLGPLGQRPNRPNSDQYPIIEAGVEGFFLFTKDGKQPYHHINDTPATLEWDDYEKVYNLSRHFLERL